MKNNIEYTFEDLASMWKTLKPEDWKAPINLVVAKNTDRRLIGEAVKKFTGAVAYFHETADGIVVTSKGYKAE